MELDKRIKEGKRPLTCIDIEQAREFVGKQCLFSDSYVNYKNIKEYVKFPQYTGALNIKDKVERLCSKEDYVFKNETDGYCYSLVLPLEWVKEEKTEPKYRPYTMKEFLREYFIGESILKIRDKREPEYVYQFLFIGCSRLIVYLGGWSLSLEQLFDNFEIAEGIGDEETWQPFGVIDEDKE